MKTKPKYVRSRCPSCGQHAKRHVYDIGSGPEISCVTCEWCWSPEGRDLKPLDIDVVKDMMAEHRALAVAEQSQRDLGK